MNLIANNQISIIIATYNRAVYLSECLKGLGSLVTDPAKYEIIIIDNNSTDNTKEITQNFIETNPNISVRYLFEPTQGASLSRNRGINQAIGEILCFLDDDAVPYPEWLDAMTEGFINPTVGCVGGPAILDYLGEEEPSWLQGDLKGLLSGYGLGYCQPTVITEIAEYPFLCNMAIRSNMLDEVGLFRTDLGPSGNNLVVGEETELIGRIRQGGWIVMYLPNAKVRHLVAPERLEKQYIYRSGLRLAVTHVCVTFDKRLNMVIRWFASDIWYATRMFFRFLAALLKRKPLWFDDYMRFWMVTERLPLRVKALIWGRQSIEFPKA